MKIILTMPYCSIHGDIVKRIFVTKRIDQIYGLMPTPTQYVDKYQSPLPTQVGIKGMDNLHTETGCSTCTQVIDGMGTTGVQIQNV